MEMFILLLLAVIGYFAVLRFALAHTSNHRAIPLISLLVLLVYGCVIGAVGVLSLSMGSPGVTVFALCAVGGVLFLGWMAGCLVKHGREFNALASALLILCLAGIFGYTLGMRSYDPNYAAEMTIFGFVNNLEHLQEMTVHWLLNIALFVPLGLLLCLAEPKRLGKALVCLAGGMAVSTLIETLQLVLRLGMCDINDVLANCIGALLGWLLWRVLLLIRTRNKRV